MKSSPGIYIAFADCLQHTNINVHCVCTRDIESRGFIWVDKDLWFHTEHLFAFCFLNLSKHCADPYAKVAKQHCRQTKAMHSRPYFSNSIKVTVNFIWNMLRWHNGRNFELALLFGKRLLSPETRSQGDSPVSKLQTLYILCKQAEGTKTQNMLIILLSSHLLPL